jgi:hypothetical protein
MSSFDDIKKKLNIDELDKESRKTMFNKFLEKGGQVISDVEEEKKIQNNSRNTQNIIDEKIRKKSDELRKRKYENKINKRTETDTRKIKRYFSIYLQGLFQGVFNLSNKFSTKFSNRMQIEFNNILSSINYYTGFIFNLDPEKKWIAVERINKNNNYSFEIIMRIYNLYKVNSISRIQDYCKKFNNIVCNQIIDDICLLFKELLILYPYWESIKDILTSSMQVYKDLVSKEPLISHIKISKNIDTLFSYYFPAFHIIIIYYFGLKIPFDFEKIYQFMDIKEADEMGAFTKSLFEEKQHFLEQMEKEKEERKKILQDSIDKKELGKIPKYVIKGLKLIDAIIEKIPSKQNEETKTKLLESNEKMLVFYFLFNEFDKEYSFILTTSQIKITPRTIGGKRIDIKQEFEELNIKFNEISSFMREYFSLMEQYSKINEDFKNAPLALDQKKTVLNIKRAQTLNEIRVRSTFFFRKFSVILQRLINDYNSEKLLIQNADDLLHFQLDLGEKRKFERISIIKAILVAFTYSSALHYYLTEDKLSTKSIYIEKEVKEETK